MTLRFNMANMKRLVYERPASSKQGAQVFCFWSFGPRSTLIQQTDRPMIKGIPTMTITYLLKRNIYNNIV